MSHRPSNSLDLHSDIRAKAQRRQEFQIKKRAYKLGSDAYG